MTTVLTINPGSNSLQAVVIDADTLEARDRADSEQELDDLLDRTSDLDAVGHRLVHGGSQLLAPTVVNDDVVDIIHAASSLAPLHVPMTLKLLTLRISLPSADVPVYVVRPREDLQICRDTWQALT